MKKLILASIILTVMAMPALAAPTVLDRGLPTTNLNNAAGADRSNVAWGFNGDYFSGDTFNIAGDKPWVIDSLTVWTAGNEGSTDYSLWVGSATGGNGLSNVGSIMAADRSIVTYDDSSTYQSQSGDFIDMYELTFDSLDLTVAEDSDYYFTVVSTDDDGFSTPLFLHASNAALSGSTQEDADDLYHWFGIDNGSAVYGGDIDSDGNGWDKSSDINVEITAVPIPAPGAILLGSIGVGFVGWMRRRRSL